MEREVLTMVADSAVRGQQLARATDDEIVRLLGTIWRQLPVMGVRSDLLSEVMDRLQSRGALAEAVLRFQGGDGELTIGTPEEPLGRLLRVSLPNGGKVITRATASGHDLDLWMFGWEPSYNQSQPSDADGK